MHGLLLLRLLGGNMATGTFCQTPGANISTHISPRGVTVHVEFGKWINLDIHEAELLESNLHNVVELALARYYLEDN
jgi:hypothetical protein